MKKIFCICLATCMLLSAVPCSATEQLLPESICFVNDIYYYFTREGNQTICGSLVDGDVEISISDMDAPDIVYTVSVPTSVISQVRVNGASETFWQTMTQYASQNISNATVTRFEKVERLQSRDTDTDVEEIMRDTFGNDYLNLIDIRPGATPVYLYEEKECFWERSHTYTIRENYTVPMVAAALMCVPNTIVSMFGPDIVMDAFGRGIDVDVYLIRAEYGRYGMVFNVTYAAAAYEVGYYVLDHIGISEEELTVSDYTVMERYTPTESYYNDKEGIMDDALAEYLNE